MELKRIKIVRTEQEVKGKKMTEFIRETQPDEEALFVCANASELDNATQTAYAVKDEKREDGFKYKVSRSTKKMRVVVSLTK